MADAPGQPRAPRVAEHAGGEGIVARSGSGVGASGSAIPGAPPVLKSGAYSGCHGSPAPPLPDTCASTGPASPASGSGHTMGSWSGALLDGRIRYVDPQSTLTSSTTVPLEENAFPVSSGRTATLEKQAGPDSYPSSAWI